MHSTDSTSTSGKPPHVLRCSSTADFLAVLPFITGFTDESSLFIVLFRGSRGEEVIRLALPESMLAATSGNSPSPGLSFSEGHGLKPTHDNANVNAMFDLVLELLHTTGAGSASPAFVLTTPLSFDGCGGVPHLRLARRLQRRVRQAGWALREFAVVANDGWCSLLDPNPDRRRDLAEITASPLLEQARSASRTPQTLQEMCTLPTRSNRRADRVETLLAELRARDARDAKHTSTPATETASRAPVWVRGVTRVSDTCFASDQEHRATDVRLLSRLIHATQQSESWLVVALTALTRPQFVMSLAHENGISLFGSLAIHRDSAGLRSSIEEVLLTLSFEQPQSHRLRRTAQVLADAAAHAPRDAAPAVLALLAWCWWMLGLQSVARAFTEMSQEIDPAHDLTLMVHRLLECPPEARLRALRFGRDLDYERDHDAA